MKLSFHSFFAYWESQSHHILESPDSCTLYFHFLNWYHQFREGFTTRWILLDTVIGCFIKCCESYIFLLLFQVQMSLTIELYHELWYHELCVNQVISQDIVYCIIVVIHYVESFNENWVVWNYLDKLPVQHVNLFHDSLSESCSHFLNNYIVQSCVSIKWSLACGTWYLLKDSSWK